MLPNGRDVSSDTVWQGRVDAPGANSAQADRWASAPAAHRIQGVLLAGPAECRAQLQRLSQEMAAQGLSDAVAVCESAADLGAWLRERTVHILVLHVEMAERMGLDSLGELRRKHHGIDWVLAWQGRSPNLVEMALRTGARGGLDLSRPAQAVVALQQVAAGQFWLPRWMLHEFYTALLNERRVLALGVLPPQDGAGPALTRRESEVLALLHEGCSNRDIAVRLGISVSTVKKHLANAFDKRGLHSRRQALA